MRSLYILPFLVAAVSCQNQPKDTEAPYTPVMDTIKVNTAPNKPEPVTKSHYSFVVIVANEPTGIYTSPVDYRKSIDRGLRQHTTDIEETTEEITEDYKYRRLDNVEKELRETLFKGLTTHYNNVATAYNITPSSYVNVVSRDIYVYDTYAEASKAREQALQINTQDNQKNKTPGHGRYCYTCYI